MANKSKKFTLEEVDALEATSFVNGMAETYTLLDEVLLQLQRSVEDVQAIYYIGDVVGKKAQQVAELQVAFDTLTQLRDMMADAYFKALDEHKGIAEKEFAKAWREDIASSKEEWPL